MRAAQVVWTKTKEPSRSSRRSRWGDFFPVLMLCIIFGLEILVLFQSPGGQDAFAMVAAEGMQQPQ